MLWWLLMAVLVAGTGVNFYQFLSLLFSGEFVSSIGSFLLFLLCGMVLVKNLTKVAATSMEQAAEADRERMSEILAIIAGRIIHVLVAFFFVIASLALYTTVNARAKQVQAQQEAEMPKWHVAAGSTLAQTLKEWQRTSGFHDVYMATGGFEFPIEIDADLPAKDFCDATRKLADGFPKTKAYSLSVSCREKEGVAMIVNTAQPADKRDANKSVATPSGGCATYKPRYTWISIDQKACQADVPEKAS